jgi:hypothetical protein
MPVSSRLRVIATLRNRCSDIPPLRSMLSDNPSLRSRLSYTPPVRSRPSDIPLVRSRPIYVPPVRSRLSDIPPNRSRLSNIPPVRSRLNTTHSAKKRVDSVTLRIFVLGSVTFSCQGQAQWAFLRFACHSPISDLPHEIEPAENGSRAGAASPPLIGRPASNGGHLGLKVGSALFKD